MTRVLTVYSTTLTNKVEGKNKLIWFRRDCYLHNVIVYAIPSQLWSKCNQCNIYNYSFIFHLLIIYWLNLSSCSRSSSSLIFSSSQMRSYLEFRCTYWVRRLLTCCIGRLVQWYHHAKTYLTKLNLRGPKLYCVKILRSFKTGIGTFYASMIICIAGILFHWFQQWRNVPTKYSFLKLFIMQVHTRKVCCNKHLPEGLHCFHFESAV